MQSSDHVPCTIQEAFRVFRGTRNHAPFRVPCD
nr:unnamed protein product [Digitaria exilis]